MKVCMVGQEVKTIEYVHIANACWPLGLILSRILNESTQRKGHFPRAAQSGTSVEIRDCI
jgi:hypothetical protein